MLQDIAAYSLVATYRSGNPKSHKYKRERVRMSACFHSDTTKMILVRLTLGDLPWMSSVRFLFVGLLNSLHKIEIQFYGLAQKWGIDWYIRILKIEFTDT